MIPDGWVEDELGAHAAFLKGSGLSKSDLVEHGPELCIHYGELFTTYGPVVDEVVSRCEDVSGACRSRRGDVLMPGSDVTPRGLATASAVMVEGVILGGDVIAIRPTPSTLWGPYLAYSLRLSKEKILRLVKGSTVYHIHAKDLSGLKIPLPPLAEQQAIAEALSDADSLVESLDALIAKKRDMKQAAMQQLLTGRTRLPGFSEEWQIRQVGDLCSPRSSRIDPRVSGGGDFCIELEHLESGTARLLGSGLTTATSSLKTKFVADDVLFGKLRSYLRKSWLANRSGVCSTEVWVLAAVPDLASPRFLAQVVQTDGFIDAASMSYGTHMPRSDWSIVAKYELEVPSLPEQEAVGTVLLDMDAEIDALVAQREKAELVKQGMMQELLSGRVRLV